MVIHTEFQFHSWQNAVSIHEYIRYYIRPNKYDQILKYAFMRYYHVGPSINKSLLTYFKQYGINIVNESQNVQNAMVIHMYTVPVSQLAECYLNARSIRHIGPHTCCISTP